MAMSETDRLSGLKRLSASRIKPGWSAQALKTWSPVNAKPTVPMLRAEVSRRASHTGIDEPRFAHWTGPQLVTWLATNAPDPDDEASDVVMMATLTPPATADEETAAERWKKHSMIPLLVNCIAYLKNAFLDRDCTVTRACIDAKEVDWFWKLLVNEFNDDANGETRVLHNSYARSGDASTRLSAERGGYVLTVDVAKLKFREMRSLLMACISKYVQSGQGDGEDVSPEEWSSQVHTTYSSSFKDFLPKDCYQKIPEELYYAYCVLVQQDLLTSLSDAMPVHARSTSTSPGLVNARSTSANPVLVSTGKHTTSSRKRGYDEAALNAPVELKRSEDEKAIFKYKAEAAKYNASAAKGDAMAKLMAEHQTLTLANVDLDTSSFYFVQNKIRIKNIEGEVIRFNSPDVPPPPPPPSPPPYEEDEFK
jgi:hypothetical protein